MKQVSIIAHSFDSLAAHVCVSARGQGSNATIATQRAVKNLLRTPDLKHKRIHSFKATVVITDATPTEVK